VQLASDGPDLATTFKQYIHNYDKLLLFYTTQKCIEPQLTVSVPHLVVVVVAEYLKGARKQKSLSADVSRKQKRFQ